MAGIYPMRGGNPSNYMPLGDDPELDAVNNVLRGILIAAQEMLRDRFEQRYAWVDGRWVSRDSPAGAGAGPLPAAARQTVAGVSRLAGILTNAQFRDPPAHHHPVSPQPEQDADRWQQLFGRPRAREAGPAAVALFAVFLVVVVVGCSLIAFLHLKQTRPQAEKLRQLFRRWFSKKAAAAHEQVSAVPAPPRDDPPPPYCAASAEPLLRAAGGEGGAAGGAGGEGGDLPPPYRCEEQLQSLLARSDGGAVGTESDARGAEAKTDECPADSGREKVCGDRSPVVVV